MKYFQTTYFSRAGLNMRVPRAGNNLTPHQTCVLETSSA